ncbi:MAG: hypothetical protein ABI199_01750 [Bacteroidia bacterium]
MKKIIFFFLIFSNLLLRSEKLFSQTTSSTTVKEKMLIIPFEPKMYMSEIDLYISQETKMTYPQMWANFRNNLNTSLALQFKGNYAPISLLSDTNELQYIYENITYEYDAVPDTSAKASSKKNQEDTHQMINGQVNTDVNAQQGFMNTKVTNQLLLPKLNKKYGADVFIFINELDIKHVLKSDADMSTSDNIYEREMTVQYSILDKAGKTITAGVSSIRFPVSVNNPKKIEALCYPKICVAIFKDYQRATKSKTAKKTSPDLLHQK